ncbi:hypothetical protein NPIL_635041 [Nephila pilipes]|uniref:Uncharacterized protein n=1 Tax=Nephila pilipes TaxID=299642 RepID=A0A8X6QQ15_NEPPI|nr:hypothetical protein NPIL_635041 [Nephila pilipes]
MEFKAKKKDSLKQKLEKFPQIIVDTRMLIKKRLKKLCVEVLLFFLNRGDVISVFPKVKGHSNDTLQVKLTKKKHVKEEIKACYPGRVNIHPSSWKFGIFMGEDPRVCWLRQNEDMKNLSNFGDWKNEIF